MSDSPKENSETVVENQPNVEPVYLNRELALLDFQRRVLFEAENEINPLLERVKFLGYVYHNLDEFFMVRVGGLKMQESAGISKLSIDGLTPTDQLAAIRKSVRRLLKSAQNCWVNTLKSSLAENGIHVMDYGDLNEKQKKSVDEYFFSSVFPILTPLAFDPGHPFPHISNLSLNLAVLIQDKKGENHFARVKVPPAIPRLIPIKRSSGGARKDGTIPHSHYFVWVEQLITENLNALFPGMEILEVHPFRLLRNADMDIQDMEAADLMGTMEESVRMRRFGLGVYLAVDTNMNKDMLTILVSNLRIDLNDVYRFDGPLGLDSLFELTKINRFDLLSAQFLPFYPQKLSLDGKSEDMFSILRQEDTLLHQPYDSFDPVINLVEAAARDPRVLAIKQTLYRTGSNSPIVSALLEARREYNKQVAVLVELKARFDEESNITWARKLEQEGAHVTYGLVGLKIHSKVLMIIRHDEDDKIRFYLHLGTGNYNAVTAHSYEDFGYMTTDPVIGADVTDLFNYLTGYSDIQEFRKILVAPINLRQKLSEKIKNEISIQENGGQGHLIFKMNALVDKPMINLLYKASQKGVKIDLIIRGLCSLVPGIDGLSENIRVASVVGRFLEHSRVYYFNNDGAPTVYMGSADLMPRNLNRRVEVLFPIDNPARIKFIREKVLNQYLRPDIKGWELQNDGTYHYLQENISQGFDIQKHFLKTAKHSSH